jgi:hypothetical protein
LVLIDSRRIIGPTKAKQCGFLYVGIGLGKKAATGELMENKPYLGISIAGFETLSWKGASTAARIIQSKSGFAR